MINIFPESEISKQVCQKAAQQPKVKKLELYTDRKCWGKKQSKHLNQLKSSETIIPHSSVNLKGEKQIDQNNSEKTKSNHTNRQA